MNIRAIKSKAGAQQAARQSEESAIYAKIHAAIVERRILPGVRLVEEQLADVFHTSRMRIRSVLQSLAHDKVVTLHRNRGAVVAYPSVREAKEVFAARRLIEVALAPDIVAKADNKALQRLKMHVKREKQGEAKPNRALELKTSHDFHSLLAEVTGNRVVVEFLRELMTQSLLITAIYEKPDVSSCSHMAHARLIRFIERGDAPGLAKAMREHLDEIEGDLVLFERQQFSADIRAVFAS
ncbi:MAG: GntR family transcriptional regulator [Pseudomonadota bacterium]|nr:GntR family transcriptional regulator [Pseudomonadota bacterium]